MKIKKSELNSDIHLSEGNLASKGNNEVLFLTWSLPSKSTCPYSTELCRGKCFAKKNESFKTVRDSRNRNLEESKKGTFVSDLIQHLEYNLQRPKAQNKKVIVRIHTSGDFYNLEYLKKWVSISEHFKNDNRIMFQSYTKSMPILREYIENNELKLDDINIHFVWSIWNDTVKEYTEYAKQIDMQTFTALPKEEVDNAIKNGSYGCQDLDCASCLECYSNRHKEIVIPYH